MLIGCRSSGLSAVSTVRLSHVRSADDILDDNNAFHLSHNDDDNYDDNNVDNNDTDDVDVSRPPAKPPLDFTRLPVNLLSHSM